MPLQGIYSDALSALAYSMLKMLLYKNEYFQATIATLSTRYSGNNHQRRTHAHT